MNHLLHPVQIIVAVTHMSKCGRCQRLKVCLPSHSCPQVEGDGRCMVLVKATAQQAEAFEAQARASRIARIHAAAGFAAVFEAMRASNKPCVGHNCMFDISYGLYSFADSFLPATWRDYKKMVRSW